MELVGFGVPGRPVALALRADLRDELLLLVFGFLLFLLWRSRLLRRWRSLARRGLSLLMGRRSLADRGLSLLVGRRSLADRGLSLLMGRRSLADRGLSLLMGRRSLADRGLSLLVGRQSLTDRGLSLLMGRRHLADRGLSLLMDRRSLANRGLSLLMGRRRLADQGLSLLTGRWKILRTGDGDGLGTQVLVRRLPRTSLGLGWALGKGGRRTGAHGRRDRMNLLRVDRLDLHASWHLVLASGLGAQSL